MSAELRKSDFKLGIIHGKIKPVMIDSEAAIQRNIFLAQRIKIIRSRGDNSLVRLFAYEMPLGYRRKRVDLLGYDKNYDLFVIELKDRKSREELSKVEKQINDYEEKVARIKHHIEKDFKEIFLMPIQFRSIRKVILAPSEFYNGKEPGDATIEYLYLKSNDVKKYRTNEIENGSYERSVKVHVKFNLRSKRKA